MGKKAKTAILLLILYFIVFWIGFKSGGSYIRMQWLNADRIEQPLPPPQLALFYTVEKPDYGSSRDVIFKQVNENDVIIKMYKNEKLRPILKQRNIEIYNEAGDRIY